MTQPKPSSDAPNKPGISARNPNASVGAAVHHDLYKVGGDSEAEEKELRGQARTLGLAFFIFFSLILSGISFSLNELWTPWVAHTTIEEGGFSGEGLTKTEDGYRLTEGVTTPQVFTFEDPGKSYDPPHEITDAPVAAQIDAESTEEDDVAPTPGQVRVSLVVNRDRIAKLYVEPKPGHAVSRIMLAGDRVVHARPGRLHAWHNAKLARTVPTRLITLVGCLFGVFALLLPGFLVPFYNFWMRFVTAPLGFVNTRIILSLVWFLMFTPLAIFFAFKRVFSPKSDSLRRTPNEPAETYWIERKKRGGEHYERLF